MTDILTRQTVYLVQGVINPVPKWFQHLLIQLHCKRQAPLRNPVPPSARSSRKSDQAVGLQQSHAEEMVVCMKQSL